MLIKKALIENLMKRRAIFIAITLYIINNFKFAEGNYKVVKSIGEYFNNIKLVVPIAFPLATIMLIVETKIEELMIVLFVLILYIIALRFYYKFTININRFHSISIFLCIYLIYLSIISYNLS